MTAEPTPDPDQPEGPPPDVSKLIPLDEEISQEPFLYQDLADKEAKHGDS